MLINDSTQIKSASFHFRTVDHPGWQELHLTFPGATSPAEFLEAWDHLPGGRGATIVGVDLFGAASELRQMEEVVLAAGIAAPVTSVLSTCVGYGGMQLVAVRGLDPAPIILRDELVGYYIEDSGTRHCFLGGIKPEHSGASREDQTREVFRTIESALAVAGMRFEHIVRTWFYNNKILDWYLPFNAIRTDIFLRHAIKRMPASTGIGAPNPAGTALVAKAVAVCSDSGGIGIRRVRSPLQCDAFAYGSAFSRALEVSDSRSRTIYVSGTASIEPGGRSVRQGDPAGQIALAMDVVSAILEEAGMKMEDATRAIAYFRDPSHIPFWNTYCLKQPRLPTVLLGCHVCRNDLLFEIEFDVSSTGCLSA